MVSVKAETNKNFMEDAKPNPISMILRRNVFEKQ